jgi:hypothetical protein
MFSSLPLVDLPLVDLPFVLLLVLLLVPRRLGSLRVVRAHRIPRRTTMSEPPLVITELEQALVRSWRIATIPGLDVSLQRGSSAWRPAV